MKHVLALLVLLCSFAPSARAQELRLAGQRSDIKQARMVVARTPAEFETLWKEHNPGQAMPPVDFEKQIVVGVFLGERREAGSRVELTLMPDPLDSTKLVVFWTEVPPARSSFTAQVKSSPYELRAVPKSYASVSFERNTKARVLVDSLKSFVEKGGFDPR